MKLRPLQYRVVVKRKDEETTSAGGIVLPGSATEKPQQGEVVAVGPGKKTNDGTILQICRERKFTTRCKWLKGYKRQLCSAQNSKNLASTLFEKLLKEPNVIKSKPNLRSEN